MWFPNRPGRTCRTLKMTKESGESDVIKNRQWSRKSMVGSMERLPPSLEWHGRRSQSTKNRWSTDRNWESFSLSAAITFSYEVLGKNPPDAWNCGNNEQLKQAGGIEYVCVVVGVGGGSLHQWKGEKTVVRRCSRLISISAVSRKRRQEVEGWLPFILQPSGFTAPVSLLPAEPKDLERPRKHQFQ